MTLVIFSDILVGGCDDMENIMYFDKPAKFWEEALPIGNGRLGAMVYSGTKELVLQMNEITLWNGEPYSAADKTEAYKYLPELRGLINSKKYEEAAKLLDKEFINNGGGFEAAYSGSYQTFGELIISFNSKLGKIKNFRRELNLSDAVCSDSFSAGAVRVEREYFSSKVDNAVFIMLKSDVKGFFNFDISYRLDHIEEISADGNTLSFCGHCDGNPSHMSFAGEIKVLNIGGDIVPQGDSLRINSADSVIICFTAATDYILDQNLNFKSGDPVKKCNEIISCIDLSDYERIKKEHIAEYRNLFNSSVLNLSSDNQGNLTLQKRLRKFNKSQNDNGLIELLFNFGKYLLISCSREDNALPANLQGLWCKDYKAPWHCDYHTNINLQMNYWCAGPINLINCTEPLAKFICSLQKNGAKTAKAYYNAPGWTLYTISNPWLWTSPGWGGGWSQYPLGGAWLCKHLVEYYNFSQDKSLLNSFYDVLKENTIFNIAILFEDENGYLMTNPATSPENNFRDDDGNEGWVCKGTAMDIEMLYENFTDMIDVCTILGRDDELKTKLQVLLKRLKPLKIGSAGQLCEWEGDWDMNAPEPHHRHVSHLYGLHPGTMISDEKTPKLADACRKTLELRGDDGTGWSLAWKINFFARLHDGNHAEKLVNRLLRPVKDGFVIRYSKGGGVYPNLFDAHPPFQIDGNFGAVSGICEMLLQSHVKLSENSFLYHFLPALPDNWSSGFVRDFLARGNCAISLEWSDNKLTKAFVKSAETKKLYIKGRFKVLCKEESVYAEYSNGITEFTSEKDVEYLLIPERN